MRGHQKLTSKQFHELLDQSKLKALRGGHKMTAKEMNLSPRIVNTLKFKDVIKPIKYVRRDSNNGRTMLWGPGQKYNHYLKEWGWI